jgi:hypothetical protein
MNWEPGTTAAFNRSVLRARGCAACASSARLAARKLLQFPIEPRGHAADVAPQVLVPFGGGAGSRRKMRAQGSREEGEHGGVDPGRFGAEEERLVPPIPAWKSSAGLRLCWRLSRPNS